MSERKYYVVWEGRAPGIYDTWEEARDQVEGFPNAKYRSYTSLEAATMAFRGDPREQLAFARELRRQLAPQVDYTTIPEIRLDAVAVDGACSANPGPIEYRCVRVADGVEIFRMGPFEGGTNNIAEYLALIHTAALLANRGLTNVPIYSDSRTAQSWVRHGHSKTTIVADGTNDKVIELLARADAWIAANRITNPIIKWDTEKWGEIPADFGRKG